MPGRHVRFASAPTFYPSSSSTSTPSPGEYHHHLPRYTTTGYSNHSPHPTSTYSSRTSRIHSLLAYSNHPTLHFDVSLPLNAITFSSSRLSTRSLAESAIEPPVSSMTLSIPHVTWPVTVTPSSNRVFITVADVLNAVYHTLRNPVTPEEYRAIRSSSDLKRVNAAYERRHGRIRDDYAAYRERQGGVRRVDFLAGHTRFLGVSSTGTGRSWVFNVTK
ncbi:hypothetical protein D9758_017384 [Tetrapyrgos nigripes]|uniref:DUF6699 domain-containing protein n=1 Tax=Tetrapyrgos nigripes TaxID=182062 RepID=A0A8H5FFG4_9AGAR|nr:hypothetical protein D9758_017384 [Tetrapyrgos nigripes]